MEMWVRNKIKPLMKADEYQVKLVLYKKSPDKVASLTE